MKKTNSGLAEPQMRAQVIRELDAALERLALDMPQADAGILLRMGIGYFAGAHAQHFGHAETARTLIKTARLGMSLAQSELAPAPDQREEVSH